MDKAGKGGAYTLQDPLLCLSGGKVQGLAEYEYSVLGKGIIEGAPDWYKQKEYPLKIQHKPHYFEDKVGAFTGRHSRLGPGSLQ